MNFFEKYDPEPDKDYDEVVGPLVALWDGRKDDPNFLDRMAAFLPEVIGLGLGEIYEISKKAVLNLKIAGHSHAAAMTMICFVEMCFVFEYIIKPAADANANKDRLN